ncbi:caspase family protein [Candidatus Pelagibacter sp.]|uniref:caspase family protein n=1 Tax=Candidatus Pelagibacter sp. TaxID=2024849 RepID=UPI003F82814B
MKFFIKLFFFSILLIVSINLKSFAEKKIISGMIITKGDKMATKSPDKNFLKKLSWNRPYSKKNFRTIIEGSGDPCFEFKTAVTYDGKKIALIYDYDGGDSSQTNSCVNEIYKITSKQNDAILATAGFTPEGKVIGSYYGTAYSLDSSWSNPIYRRSFIVIVSSSLIDLCIKQASDSGVANVCYNFTKAQTSLGSIVQQRVKAIKEREVAKGNIVEISAPNDDIETSNKDKTGPKIDIPGKLIAKNDQIILSGQITDDSQISSVKIDNEPITLDSKGNFEMALYVPYDGLKLSVEAIDKFANKSSRIIVIDREEITQSENIVKLPSLNPTKVNARENNSAVALIVGITNYKNIPLAIYADNDAKMFSDFAYRSLGVSRDKIKLLVNETANFVEIKKTIKRWLQNEIKSGETDVYLFFAGHGLVSDNQKDLYLLPYDGEPSLLDDTSIKRSELFSIISESNPKSVTAFLDTCYSGLTRENKMLIASARPLKIVAEENAIPININLITAAANNEIANGLEAAEHGMFSYYLMEGLSGNADSDNDKNITLGELYSYLSEKVKDKSSKLGRQQNPQLSGDKDKVLVSLN